jgi:hypothetical protein
MVTETVLLAMPSTFGHGSMLRTEIAVPGGPLRGVAESRRLLGGEAFVSAAPPGVVALNRLTSAIARTDPTVLPRMRTS